MPIIAEICGLPIGDKAPVRIMGVLNLSEESFYKASYIPDSDSQLLAAKAMIKAGATMLDIGARSTAPGVTPISITEEMRRIKSSFEFMCSEIPKEIILSADTQYGEVAQLCYEIANKNDRPLLINDVSNLHTDPNLRRFILKTSVPIILMASKLKPGDCLTMDEVLTELRVVVEKLSSAGYPRTNIIIDPGVGKWVSEKLPANDLSIMNRMRDLRILNLPILVAISRKSFIGALLNLPKPDDRLQGTLAATAIAVYNGAHIIRTHDVNLETIQTIKIAQSIRDAGH